MNKKLSEVEKIKVESNYLRGTIEESLHNPLTGSIATSDTQLIKFHGSYQQDDRDRRKERNLKKLEPAYSFMLRLRIPAGKITAEQMSNVFAVCDENATGVVKITTRQTVQLHGVLKTKLKPTIAWFDKYNLDSIAACGDVNRNVIATSNYLESEIHEQIVNFCHETSKNFMPKTSAYQEIWLDQEKVLEKKSDEVLEPLYGQTYLPRKFKIAVAIPPYNDIDVYANDIGLIAVIVDKKLQGFNVLAGGGMGMTHGNSETYPRIGSDMGYVALDQVHDVMRAIIEFQRDNGNRSDRKKSRLKYTIDNFGLDEFIADVAKRSGVNFAPKKEVELKYRGDFLGWRKDYKGDFSYMVFIENGRIVDNENHNAKTALKEIAALNLSTFTFSANQNIAITDVKEKDKETIDAILAKYKINSYQENINPIRKNALACVALNTCALALAEAQRYLPSLITKIEVLLEKYNLLQDNISIRMTGCPNGCARPYLAEVALVGSGLGEYNMYIGGDNLGFRLNQLYKTSMQEPDILKELEGFFIEYSKNKTADATLGDFLHGKLT